MAKKIILTFFILASMNICIAGERQFTSDYPESKNIFDEYKWYINYKNGKGSCNNVYAFNAGSPTPQLNIFYISCDKDKSEWLIGINVETGKPINAVPIKLYRE